MKFKNGQRVSYEICGENYSGIIRETNIKDTPYEIKFIEKPITNGLIIIDSLVIHKSNVGKIIGTNILKNE